MKAKRESIKPVYKVGSVAERRAKGVLLPTARIGRGKYRRGWVKSPENIKRGEELLEMWQKEWEEAEVDPTRYAHIAWIGKHDREDAEVKVKVTGRFYTEEEVKKKVKNKLERWTGKIPVHDDVRDKPSPDLCLIKISKEPTQGIKYRYNPKKLTRTGRYGFGTHITSLNGY